MWHISSIILVRPSFYFFHHFPLNYDSSLTYLFLPIIFFLLKKLVLAPLLFFPSYSLTIDLSLSDGFRLHYPHRSDAPRFTTVTFHAIFLPNPQPSPHFDEFFRTRPIISLTPPSAASRHVRRAPFFSITTAKPPTIFYRQTAAGFEPALK